jgi:hypothetical protein
LHLVFKRNPTTYFSLKCYHKYSFNTFIYIEIKEAFAYNMAVSDKKQIKKIIYQHFDLIVEAWNNYFNK